MRTVSAPVFQFLWQCCKKKNTRNYIPQSLKIIRLPQSVSKSRVQTGISKLKFTINILMTVIVCALLARFALFPPGVMVGKRNVKCPTI